MELSDLKIMKPRYLKVLNEQGIESVEALAMSSPASLSEIDGISDKMAKSLVWGAREVLNLTEFKRVSEIQENFEHLTTGSKNFDEILNGGISTGRITEIFGAFKSGKTNLCHTLCVTAQLPKEKGGLGGAVLYIDTENTFAKEKIGRIARRFGQDPQTILSNIYHARIFSTDHQLQMVRAAEAAIKTKGARLIIVDSLMAILRAEYIGIGMLANRQQILNQIIRDLSRLAETYNIAVVVTNQVATVMKGVYTTQDAIGGNIVAHGCHFRIQFKTKGFSMNQSLERTAVIVDSVDLAPNEAVFFITEAGIADTEEVQYEIEDPEDKKKKKAKKKQEEEILVSAAEDEGHEDPSISEMELEQTIEQEDVAVEEVEINPYELESLDGLDVVPEEAVEEGKNTKKGSKKKKR
jgi:DNA repair protein RadA